MRKKMKNMMKYSNDRFNKQGQGRVRKNGQRTSRVIIPKDVYARFKSENKKKL